MRIINIILFLMYFHSSHSQTVEELKVKATAFPEMPRGTADMTAFVSGTPTFASGAPFNDVEFTLLDTDYMDGENSGGDVFMPVDPSRKFPGSDNVKYVRCILNTDLDIAYGSAKTDRIILGTAEIPYPFFSLGTDGVDNDYAVIHHLDYNTGYIQLKGAADDYQLVYCTPAEGCETEGWYLFYTKDDIPDLIAFIYPCWDIEPSVSGNAPNNPNPICNADSLLSLTNPNHFKYAKPIDQKTALAEGVIQYGSEGKEIVSGITVDQEGFMYLYGCSDGNLDGQISSGNEIFVSKIGPDGSQLWVTELAMSEGTILKDAVTDSRYLYAAGRTLGALPGFANAGRWDAILLKLDLQTGEIVATDQFGNPGIDGYGNIVLDDAGNLFVSAQGSPAGQATTDDVYLVAKHRKSDLSNIWRALNRPNVSGFVASAEAWGGLTYVRSETPGNGRLIAGGWYFGPRGANAFVSIYENLNSTTPSRPHSIIIDTPGTAADWVLDNVVDSDGNIFVAGFTTGNLGSDPLGEGDAYIIKYSPQLTNPVIRQFGTNKSDLIRKLAVDEEDNIYGVGYSYGNYDANNQDPSLLSGDIIIKKFDQNLNSLQTKQLGTPHEDRGFLDFKHNTLYIGGMTEGTMVASSHGSFDGFAFAMEPSDLTLKTPQQVAITRIEDRVQSTQLNIYPNPTSNQVTISYHGSQYWNYSIYSLKGEKVAAGISKSSQKKLSVSDYPPGLYMIKVDTETPIKFLKK